MAKNDNRAKSDPNLVVRRSTAIMTGVSLFVGDGTKTKRGFLFRSGETNIHTHLFGITKQSDK
jgi:hypothetical protein